MVQDGAAWGRQEEARLRAVSYALALATQIASREAERRQALQEDRRQSRAAPPHGQDRQGRDRSRRVRPLGMKQHRRSATSRVGALSAT